MPFPPGIPDPTYTADDDQFHELDDQVWQTETAWFSFHVPERRMSGWLYGFLRPNIGVCTSSVFVYDDIGSASYEIPFHEHQQAQPAPRHRDLRDFQFPAGYHLKMLEPVNRYRMTYEKDDLIAVDLEFDAIMDPHPYNKGAFSNAAHHDQFGHVTGRLTLRGESIDVDCYSMHDRSWGPRTDVAPPNFNRLSYDYGCARDDNGFCVFSAQTEMGEGGSSPIGHGFWLKDGRRVQVVQGVRTVTRDPVNIWADRIEIEATDADGDHHRAVGRALSHFLWTPSRWITCLTFLEWDIDGHTGYGEDQDLWRYDQMSLARRSAWQRRPTQG